MSYADITDSTNPFATSGLSREVRAILAYVQAARRATGADFVCTSTTDHPKYTASGNLSRHLMQGTDGVGLAVDLRMRTRSVAVDFHDRVFNIFIPVETRLHELIYAFPPVGKRADGSTGFYNIRARKRVAPYAVSDHRDHIHVSVDKGVFLEYPQQSATEVRPMFDPAHRLLPIVASLNYPGGGALLLAENGALYAYGCPNNGAPDGKRYFEGRKAARLEYNPRWEEAGRPEPHKSLPWYIVVAASGEPYGHGGF